MDKEMLKSKVVFKIAELVVSAIGYIILLQSYSALSGCIYIMPVLSNSMENMWDENPYLKWLYRFMVVASILAFILNVMYNFNMVDVKLPLIASLSYPFCCIANIGIYMQEIEKEE